MRGPGRISCSLLLGAELVLYEGAPDYPSPDRLWALVARHGVTHLGLSPTVIRALMAHGTDPIHEHDLSSLRVLGSAGGPRDPGAWRGARPAAPPPGMARGFGHDRELYLESYWSRIPGTWVHGDWALVDADGY